MPWCHAKGDAKSSTMEDATETRTTFKLGEAAMHVVCERKVNVALVKENLHV